MNHVSIKLKKAFYYYFQRLFFLSLDTLKISSDNATIDSKTLWGVLRGNSRLKVIFNYKFILSNFDF